MVVEKDIETAHRSNIDVSELTPFRAPYPLYITPFEEILAHQYRGEGTHDTPFIVEWLPNDPENPQTWRKLYKWSLIVFVSLATLSVAFCSSTYVGDFEGVMKEFGSSVEVITLVTLNAGSAGSQNIWTLLILRFLAGAFGSSPLTNAAGTIADVFSARERGLGIVVFASAPFLGPTLGPIIGNLIGQSIGWRWVQGIMAIFTGVIVFVGIFIYPETYTPVLIRPRASKLSKVTGFVYRSKFEEREQIRFGRLLRTSLSRPWIFLFREPIVLLLSIYMVIIYGILYMLFGAFPIVFNEERGWSPTIGGLAFIGIACGFIIGMIYCVFENRRYSRLVDANAGQPVPPEQRLPPAIVGAFALPIGLFLFAWTNYPSIHFTVPIAAGIPFGFGTNLVFLSLMNYLVDAYVIYAASVLAANLVLRSLFGVIFPLFTTQMFHNLGIHWASAIPACLALLCLPLPFVFWKYGVTIRSWSKYSCEAAAFMDRMSKSNQNKPNDETKRNPAMEIVVEKADDLKSVSVISL
ncbi:unnamed protein product [Rotaria magnacalcarata]|uniref:Major facilitator superfamily (MFS) profile domain-containing protein n=2 Tax=Rotaria magnacalcarata TaxID=392030 RepID=A0A816YB93_9BILA|nr:unnamed protein product [Rotaria magnacalcarata]